MKGKYKHWKYKNTFLLIISLAALFYFADTPHVRNVIAGIGNLGYFGAFLTGIFFVSTFTVAPASLVLFHLAKVLSPLEVALFAGLGAVVGDYIIFRFLKDRVYEELKPLVSKIGRVRLTQLFATPFFAWVAPVVGAIIIASPLPDEIGVGLLGISRLKNWQFLLISFLLNTIGIFLVIILARAL